ncbi:hypothetical protein [Lacrimispora sp.]|uniref:hypothetical protein n=1 Tax=Lacrimispora sp. TaxID=2719234 RepID=UPI00345F2235
MNDQGVEGKETKNLSAKHGDHVIDTTSLNEITGGILYFIFNIFQKRCRSIAINQLLSDTLISYGIKIRSRPLVW